MKTEHGPSRTMIAALLLAGACLSAAPSRAADGGAAKHEAAEDKARSTPGSPSKGLKACHQDIEALCAGIKPGESRLGACLKANKERLSKPCRDWAAHGGKEHEDEAYLEIDKAKPAAAPAPKKRVKKAAPPRP